MPVPSESLIASGRKPPAIGPKPSHLRQSASSITPVRARTVFSKYLMNDIPRGTTRAQLINCLQPAISLESSSLDNRDLQVRSGCLITNSRLDDELSVAVIEFSDTPAWLQHLNQDVCGFPKKTVLGTLWKGVDMIAVDEHGRTEFIRAAIAGNLLYAETLAEFSDTDINVQDNQRRTALHWACAENHIDVVKLCLTMPECDVGLKDDDSLTAFDIALERDEKMIIPALFYQNLMDMDERHPQTALLRMLTMTSAPVEDKVVFPGAAIFEPIEESNTPLVKALIERGIDYTVRNSSGDTALHVAAEFNEVEIAIRLINAGSDVNAKGKGGATPLHYAVQKSEKRMVQALLSWEAKPDALDDDGKTPLQLAKYTEMVRHEFDRKANDVENRTPLYRATEDGDTDIVCLLLDLGVPVDEGETTALMCAARMGYHDIRELLIDAGANVAATDMDGQTALHMATKEDITQLLVNGGATITSEVKSEQASLLPPDVNMASDGESQPVIDPKEQETMDAVVGNDGDTEIPTATAEKGEKGIVALPIGLRQDDVTSLVVTDMKEQETMGAAVGEIEIPALTAPITIRYYDGTSLVQAARIGDFTTVVLLLNSGVDIEHMDRNKQTALHSAAEWGHVRIILLLLDRGARVNRGARVYRVSPADGCTGLHSAAGRGHLLAVQALLAAGANVESVGRSGASSLYVAAAKGHSEIVHALLAGGANVEATYGGATSLYAASENGHTETVQALLAGGADVEAVWGGKTSLYIAAVYGHTETVQALLAGGANVEAAWIGETSLLVAAGMGHTETVQALLAGGANVEAVRDGQTSLLVAAQKGHTEAVQALLAGGANVEATYGGATSLYAASENGHTETVQALLAGGAYVEATFGGATSLYAASQNGHTETVQALLAGGANVESVGRSGATPLSAATRNGHAETVQGLLAGGANVEAVCGGKTSLYIAAVYGHTETVQALLAGGANVEAAWIGQTSLLVAAGMGHTETVQALLAGGADVEALNVHPETSLYIAAEKGHTEAVQALLAGGASMKSTWSGKSALHIAARHGRTETVQTLLFYGADFNRWDNRSRTPLRLAITYGHEETANALRAARVDLPFQHSVGRRGR